MHELSICQSLLSQIEQTAQFHNVRFAKRVVLGIGPLSGVVDDLLRRAFELLQPGSVAENAILVIESCPVIVECPTCFRSSEVPSNKLVCPHCQEWRTSLISGDGLVLMQIEFFKE